MCSNIDTNLHTMITDIVKISPIITYISICNIKSTLLVGSLPSMNTNEGAKIGGQIPILRSAPRHSVFIHIRVCLYIYMTVLWPSLQVSCSSTCTSDERNMFGLFGRGVGVCAKC